jgi:hypothetical protein
MPELYQVLTFRLQCRAATTFMKRSRVPYLVLVVCLTCLGMPAQKTSPPAAKAPSFSESDAADALSRMRLALEGYDKSAFLKLFDPARMANYPAFRDQISQFFDKYQSFVVSYQLQQVSTEDAAGIVLSNFSLEATGATVANLRRNFQLRLVMAWDGKQWKIVDIAPLGLFS